MGNNKPYVEIRCNTLPRQMDRIEGEIAMISDKHVLDAIDQLPDEELDAVWGKEIETEELDEILDRKIEDKKRSLEIEWF